MLPWLGRGHGFFFFGVFSQCSQWCSTSYKCVCSPPPPWCSLSSQCVSIHTALFIPYDLLKVLPVYIGVPKVEALHLHIKKKIILGEFQIFYFILYWPIKMAHSTPQIKKLENYPFNYLMKIFLKIGTLTLMTNKFQPCGQNKARFLNFSSNP